MNYRVYLFIALTSFSFLPAAQAAPTISSIYTSLTGKACKTIEANENEGGSYKGRCPGVGGYQLILMEGDIRQTLNVVTPTNHEFPLELWSVVSSGFSTVGEKAEWRVQKKNGKPVPVALIVRFNASENPEKPEQTTSYLTVSKITAEHICVTDVIKPQAKANELARTLADTAQDRACKQ